jgi:MbtH protein
MVNPFEDPHGAFLVLGNTDGQLSLWPAAIDVPAGWSVILGVSSRDACLAHVERHWADDRSCRTASTGGR